MSYVYAKGKRAKKAKINYKKIVIVIAIIVVVILIIYHNSKKTNSEEIIETTAQVVSEPIMEENNVEIAISEPQEDEKIKALIENKIAQKNLKKENFAFFYYNVETNKSYFYNEESYFRGASTVKVPVAMLYYDKINNGELTLNSTLEYTSDCYESGSGLTDYAYDFSDKVPIHFLLEQSIVNSDNTANNILVKNVGKKQYRYEIAEYSGLEFQDEFYTDNITCAKYGFDILKHLYENIENYSGLIEYMQRSSNEKYLKKYVDNYKIAHKYGSYDGNVHDYGIVFGKTTYLIGVYTKGIANADELIANISLEISNAVNK